MKKPFKYTITGTSGLISSFLNERLQRKGNVSMLEVDTRKGFNVRNINDVKVEDVDFMFHLAAHCKIHESLTYPDITHGTNVDGTFAVMEFCRKNKIPNLVYFSSSRVLSPERNPYVATKIYGEELTKAYHSCYGLDYAIIRPSTVYGPYCPDLTGRLITDWVKNAINKRPLILYGDEKKTLDFTHIDDFLDGVDLILDNWETAKNTDYNISGGKEIKLVTLADIIFRKVRSGTLEFKNPEKTQPQRVHVDISKIQKLGYEPKVKFKDGVEELIELYQQHYGKRK